jgi:triacylglycerol lipase
MSSALIPYDTSADGVFHPERRPPLTIDASWSTDAVIAEMCRLSYFRFENSAEGAATVTRALAGAGFSGVHFFPRAAGARLQLIDTQAIGAIDAQGRPVVSFRGTQPDSLSDVLTDLKFWRTRWRGAGRVHTGFWRALNSVLAPIEQWLDQHAPGPVTVAGHSLGGALATLLAAVRPEASLITFGSPAVGDREFADSIAGRTCRRYVDCSDVVVSQPPTLLGFCHVPGLLYIDAAGHVWPAETTPPLIADRATAEIAFARHIAIGNALTRQLADHAPINYISAILGRRVGP